MSDPATSPTTTTAAPLEAWVRDLLRCPVTGAPLVDGVGPDGTPELVSTDPDRPLAYPVRDGVPVLLADEARPVTRPATPGGEPAGDPAGAR